MTQQTPSPNSPHAPGYPAGYQQYQQPPAHAGGQAPALPGQLASQGARLGARLIDVVIILAAATVVTVLITLLQATLGQDSSTGPLIGVIGYGALIICLLGYEPWMVWRYSATIGKRLLGLRIVRLTGDSHISGGRALGRAFFPVAIGLVPLGGLLNVLWCLWDAPYRQCLHDKVVQTTVVRRQS